MASILIPLPLAGEGGAKAPGEGRVRISIFLTRSVTRRRTLFSFERPKGVGTAVFPPEPRSVCSRVGFTIKRGLGPA